MNKGRGALFYLIKLIRLYKGFKIFDIPRLMKIIKIGYKERSQKMIETDKQMAEDQILDHNKIEEILNIGYLLKITKLIIIILNLSYLLSMFWYIMCKLVEDWELEEE